MFLASNAAERWLCQYPNDRDGIGEKVRALGPTPNPDDVDRIIGNGSWTRTPRCSECGQDDKDCIVELGQEPDYGSSTAWICQDCIDKASQLVASFPSQRLSVTCRVVSETLATWYLVDVGRQKTLFWAGTPDKLRAKIKKWCAKHKSNVTFTWQNDQSIETITWQ